MKRLSLNLINHKWLNSASSVPFVVFFILSYVFVHNTFKPLAPNEFLFVGDHFLRFNFFETAMNFLFVRRIEGFGVNNSWQFIVQFWDILAYLVFFKFGVPLLVVEKILLFSTSFFSLVLSYIGFRRLSKQFFTAQTNIYTLMIIAIWFVFNPYTFTFWHGGVYNIGLMFVYALLPLTMSKLLKVLFFPANVSDALTLSILLFLGSFTFWLFASAIFSYLTLTVLYVVIASPPTKSINIKLISLSGVVYALLSSFVVFNLYNGFVELAGYPSPFTSPTFSNQQGGMLYQMLMYFSWGIYTEWTPRALYPFGRFFFSPLYIISIIALYGGLLVAVIQFFRRSLDAAKSPLDSKKWLIAAVAFFFISVFFAKGPQPPLGEVFMSLYKYVPVFRVFRSADARFGMCVVFSVALLLLYASRVMRTRFFAVFLISIITAQSYLLFGGTGVRGMNVREDFYDRVISIPSEYQDLVSFLNDNSEPFGYVFSVPPVIYGHFILQDGERHIGQDLLPKLTRLPFFYLSLSTTGLYEPAYEWINQRFASGNYKSLSQLPIRYVLVRRDIHCTSDCYDNVAQGIASFASKVFSNELFDVYLLPDSPGAISGAVNRYSFVNPTKYYVEFKTGSNGELYLNTSFGKNWKIFAASDTSACFDSGKTFCPDFFNIADIQYAFKKPLFDETHVQHGEFKNKWVLPQDTPNPSKYVIFFVPQAYLYVSLIVSSFTLFFTCTWLVILRLKKSC